jgi:hypothetical protein
VFEKSAVKCQGPRSVCRTGSQRLPEGLKRWGAIPHEAAGRGLPSILLVDIEEHGHRRFRSRCGEAAASQHAGQRAADHRHAACAHAGHRGQASVVRGALERLEAVDLQGIVDAARQHPPERDTGRRTRLV